MGAKRSESIQRHKPASAPQGPALAADAPAPSVKAKGPDWLLWLVLGCLTVAGVATFLIAARPIFTADDPEQFCRQFADLKNADDPQADTLLGPPPAVPAVPVTREEADRLDAEIMLRQAFHVRKVYRDPGGLARFVLVAEGALSSERITIQAPRGPEVGQRAMWSPDLVVEVRDGQLHGVRARLHEGP